jgi:hypothetical protein
MWHLLGALYLRINTVGFEPSPPLKKWSHEAMVRTAMEEGAMGVGRH